MPGTGNNYPVITVYLPVNQLLSQWEQYRKKKRQTNLAVKTAEKRYSVVPINASATTAAAMHLSIKKIADLRAADHENIPEIFRVIKRNYEILKAQGSLGQDEQFYFDAKILADEGFNFNFCTSI